MIITIRPRTIKKIGVSLFAVWYALFLPGIALGADAVDASGNATGTQVETGAVEPTGAPENTGAPVCTGAGCGQGAGQGTDQGVNQGVSQPTSTPAVQGASQGGPTLEDLGGTHDEEGNTVLPDGVEDTRQGAQQGKTNGFSGVNSNTGADSTNTAAATVEDQQQKTVSNTANDATAATLSGTTGDNDRNKNSGSGAIKTGNASVGVTQVKNDNTTTDNGTVGLNVNGHNGDYEGDLELDFANAVAMLTGSGGNKSVRAVNDTTGEGSENDVVLSTRYEDITEIENDGRIDNDLDVEAISGRNNASMNTGDGIIRTGDSNVAATLVNLLNTTVLNGNLTVSVEDIFGNMTGDIKIPDLAQLASVLSGSGVRVDVANEETGADSTNDIDVDITEEETTTIDNDADINTNIAADAITGQNDALSNTGGGEVDTGDASVSASNISLANTTVEGGNWGLVVVNALNKWLGFLVGDSGDVRQLSQAETIREIEARNEQTGANSDNTIDIDDETITRTNIDNDAVINNNVSARAISGQNEASMNTGKGRILTGEANVLASAVNIANTTVKNANLGIAVVNIFGDWIGDLLYGGKTLFAGSGGGGGQQLAIDANNGQTGANSDNTIDVNYDRTHETNIDNNADIETILAANVDTGNNRANSNTLGGDIETGKGFLALHSRAIANLTGIAAPGGVGLSIEGGNEETGFDSTNTVTARVNNERILNVTNDANVSTVLPGTVNTGNNEASMNTVGGNIDTGSIDASVQVHDMVNRLMLAMGSGITTDECCVGGGEIDAELINRLTGAFSTNENTVEYANSFWKDIINNADIDKVIDLLFNTGGNETNKNTIGRLIDKEEPVGGGEEKPEAPKEEKPKGEDHDKDKPEGVGGGVVEEDKPGQGGGILRQAQDEEGRVAGAKVARQPVEEITQPVKEAMKGAQLAVTGMNFWQRRDVLWSLFAAGSVLLMAGAVAGDRKNRSQQLAVA